MSAARSREDAAKDDPMPDGMLEEMIDDMWAARCRHYGVAEEVCPDDERLDLMEVYAKAAWAAMRSFPVNGVSDQ